MSTQQAEPTVEVRRQWNDYRSATYRLSDVEELHWSRVSGGVRATAPQPFVPGYVRGTEMISGELAHSCSHGPAPHRILVCLTMTGKEEAWPEILKRAGPKPKRSSVGWL